MGTATRIPLSYDARGGGTVYRLANRWHRYSPLSDRSISSRSASRGGLPVLQHGLHLAGDRHLDPMPGGQFHGGVGGLDALGDHLRRCDDVVECAALGQLKPTVRLRLSSPVQVRTRSPSPAKPARV